MTKLETNAQDVYSNFEKLTHKELGKALRTGLRKATKTIQKAVKSKLRASFKNVNKKNEKYNDTLESGVRVTRVYENIDGTLVAKVRIDSTRKSGSGSFRLQILESGNYKTKPRYTKSYAGKPLKKPRFAGNIEGAKFFAQARDANEPYFYDELTSEVDKAVRKINNGK